MAVLYFLSHYLLYVTDSNPNQPYSNSDKTSFSNNQIPQLYTNYVIRFFTAQAN